MKEETHYLKSQMVCTFMRIAIGQDLTSLFDVGPIAVLLAYFAHYSHNCCH